jgi:hypothetical protein
VRYPSLFEQLSDELAAEYRRFRRGGEGRKHDSAAHIARSIRRPTSAAFGVSHDIPQSSSMR